MHTPFRPLLAAGLLAFSLGAAAPAFAQPSLGAYGAVREALLAVWDEMPFTALNVTLTSEPAKGFGQYETRSERSFAPGETVNVYAELVGYGAMATANGFYVRELAADLTLVDAEGNVRASQPNFFTSSTTTPERLLETYLSFTVTLGDFEPGDYVLRYAIRDLAGEKQASFELPITLTAATPAGG